MDLKSLQPDLDLTLSNLHHTLMSCRNSSGIWEGHLSSSALSTAIAIIALSLTDEQEHRELIWAGSDWLARNQNEDGGWGDTTLSKSNISTTVLCWAARSLRQSRKTTPDTIHRQAEKWIIQHAGGLTRRFLVQAIIARYGKDRTFSIPILSALTMTGKLGPEKDAWHQFAALPFEFAALPHRFFKWLRLPVVSYALPALIALGQVRHYCAPTRNPLAFLFRQMARRKTLRILREIQPQSGGFLEAAPLTGFVVMSLSHINRRQNPVVLHGVEFIKNNVRPDGSWPIDTNLATWVTTLAVNGLARHPKFISHFSVKERRRIQDWLLQQQYKQEHPFTHAEPGGWAWTDLSGGVPDADDTPGTLLALKNLGLEDKETLVAARNGTNWLLSLQNRDGGTPTFCRGWGYLPFDRSSPDLTAHTLRAFCAWKTEFSALEQSRIEAATSSAIGYLLKTQRKDGAWIPLWFGNQHAANDENPTYGVSRVLLALADLTEDYLEIINKPFSKAVHWLLAAQNKDGGWGGNKNTPSTIEETAVAVDALARVFEVIQSVGNKIDYKVPVDKLKTVLGTGVSWLMHKTNQGTDSPPNPVGFYFARLWYYEQLYPVVFTISALNRVISLLDNSEVSD